MTEYEERSLIYLEGISYSLDYLATSGLTVLCAAILQAGGHTGEEPLKAAYRLQREERDEVRD